MRQYKADYFLRYKNQFSLLHIRPGAMTAAHDFDYLFTQPAASQGLNSAVNFALAKAVAFLPKISYICTASSYIL